MEKSFKYLSEKTDQTKLLEEIRSRPFGWTTRGTGEERVWLTDATLLLFIKRNEDAIKKYYASDDYYYEQENE